MALELGINSCVSVEDANIYFADRLDVAAWNEAGEVMRGQALVMATSTFEELPWDGTLLDAAQLLCWPRVGEYYDVGRNQYIPYGLGVPKRVAAAYYELAYHYLNNDGIFDETGSVANLKIAGISLDRITPPSRLPRFIMKMVTPFLIAPVKPPRSWWRAN